MITIENKEVRTSRHSCNKVTEKSFLVRSALHNPKANNMLSPGVTSETRDTIKNYQLTLNMAELIMTNEMQRYASRIKQYMQENGLYKQRPKKTVNNIMGALQKMQFDFTVFEQYTTMASVSQSFPIYKNDYIYEGESVYMKMMQGCTKEISEKLQLMFFGYKQLFDKHRFPHSELIAAAYTIMEMSLTSRDVSKTVHTIMDQKVYGYITGRWPSLRVLDNIEVSVRELLSDVFRDRDMECDSNEFVSIRKPLESIAVALVNGRPVKGMLNAVAEHTFRYMDFCIVKLWLASHQGLTVKERNAVDELGIDTDALIAQLRSLPLPEEYDDVWDLQEALPSGEEIDGTPICEFYLKCCDRVPYIMDLRKMKENCTDYQL